MAGYGGGIASYGDVTLWDSSFVFNEGRYGAGLFVGTKTGGGSAADVRRTLFNLGNALEGGGIYTDDANAFVSVSDSVFSRNTAAEGGGLARFNSRVDISNSSFTDNASTNDGGGLWITHGPANSQDPSFVTLTSVTIARNMANLRLKHGGGYYNLGISVLKNVTIKDNTNGIYNTGLSQLNIYNTVLDNPNSLNCDGGTPLTLGGHNLSTDTSCGVEQNNVPAQLGPPALNTDGINQTLYYLPLAGSPLINAAAGCPTLDQRGAPRPDACDIGAVEYGAHIDQSIQFGPIANKSLSDSPFVITATSSSGLPVDFSTSTPSICTVTSGPPIAGGSSAKVVLSGVGTCTLVAQQPGDQIFINPAPAVTQTFNVTVGKTFLPLILR